MTEPDPPGAVAPTTRQRLRAELKAAMQRRDRTATAVLRATLGVVDNAEAVAPALGAGDGGTGSTGGAPIAGGVVGLGAAEVARREVGEAEVRALVEAELADREAHAEVAARAGRTDHADAARAEAAVLRALLEG